MIFLSTNSLISILIFICLIGAFLWSMRRIMKRDNYINDLIIGFLERGEISQDELLDKMYSYGCSDFRLKSVIAKHQATREDYALIFEKLIYWANFKKRRRYIPINSFFFAGSLGYLLEHKNEDAKKITMKMMNYFHF